MLMATRGHTMLRQPKHVSLYREGSRILRTGLPGAFAEFGVARGGGMGILARQLTSAGRHLHLFDTWGELPAFTPEDGAAAPALEKWIEEGGFEELAGQDPRGDAKRLLIGQLGMPAELVSFHQGKFEETLSEYSGEPIVFAHVDSDWYTSTATVLEFLDRQLTEQAIVVADDFGYLEGVAKALEEWRAASGRSIRLIPGKGQAVLEVGRLDNV
jgi:Macrocin-O-methyltransferase (TylF)